MSKGTLQTYFGGAALRALRISINQIGKGTTSVVPIRLLKHAASAAVVRSSTLVPLPEFTSPAKTRSSPAGTQI